MKWALASILAFMLLWGQAFAAWPYDAVCDITNTKGTWNPQKQRMEYNGGSAVLIGVNSEGTKGLVLTCWHTFQSNNSQEAAIRFEGYKERWPARRLGYFAERDLSMWEINNPPPIKTSPISLPRKNDGPFTAVGYPGYGEGQQHHSTGDFLGFNDQDSSLFYATMPVYSGFSGGAMFNTYGELCGIVLGNTPVRDNGNGTVRPMEGQPWMARLSTGEEMLKFVRMWMVLD